MKKGSTGKRTHSLPVTHPQGSEGTQKNRKGVLHTGRFHRARKLAHSPLRNQGSGESPLTQPLPWHSCCCPSQGPSASIPLALALWPVAPSISCAWTSPACPSENPPGGPASSWAACGVLAVLRLTGAGSQHPAPSQPLSREGDDHPDLCGRGTRAPTVSHVAGHL